MEISLKTQGAWSGLSYESDKEPTSGLFRRLRGAYISKDGTEIVRFPGLGLVAEPGYMAGPFAGKITGGVGILQWTSGSFHYLKNAAGIYGIPMFLVPHTDYGTRAVTAVSVANPAVITVSSVPLIGTFNVTITGNTGAPTLNGSWLATWLSATTFSIPLDNTAGTATADGNVKFTGSSVPKGFTVCNYVSNSNLQFKEANFPGDGGLDEAYVSRIFYINSEDELESMGIHGLIDCLGLPVIAYEARKYVDADNAGVALWGQGSNQSPGVTVGIRPLSFDNPLRPDDFRNWESTCHANILQDIQWARKGVNNYSGAGTLPYNTKQIPRLVHLESYDGRVIISAPGYGCMFEVNIKDQLLADYGDGIIGVGGILDALGVPQGVVSEAGITFTADAVNGNVLNSIIVYCRVACYNSRTGEIGRVSSVISGKAPAAGGPFTASVVCLIPRWIMRETQADTLILYSSTFNVSGNAASLMVQRIVDASSYAPDPVINIVFASSGIPSPNPIPGTGFVPYIPQLPDGSLWSKALKGHLFSGGRIGAEEIIDGSIVSAGMIDDGYQLTVIDPLQVSGKGIPTSMAGSFYLAERPPGKVRLVRLIHSLTAKPYEMVWDYHGSGNFPIATSSRSIQLAKGHVQFSEKERPGEVPEGNRIIADRLSGRDVIACGRFRNSLVLCTDRETYVLSWGTSPSGADPTLISPTHGCVAPSSMIQTDVGLFWISDRGPVFCDGSSVRWVGRSLSKRFTKDLVGANGVKRENRYMKAKSRMMWNIRGTFDTERRLAIWAMRSDAHNDGMANASTNVKITGITTANPPLVTVEDPLHMSVGIYFYSDISGIIGMEPINGTKIKCLVKSSNTFETVGLNSTGYAYVSGGVVSLGKDAAQSKSPCDEILMLQVDSMAFSSHEFQGDMMISGIANMDFDDGSRRPCLIDGTTRQMGEGLPNVNTPKKGDVFGFDEAYSDRMKDTLSAVATVDISFSGSDPVFTSSGANFQLGLRNGSGGDVFYEAFIRSGQVDENGDYELLWWGKVKNVEPITGDDLTLQTPQGMPTPSWKSGDVIEVGIFNMEIETHAFNLDDLGEGLKDAKGIQGIVIDHDVRREINTNSTPTVAWVYAEIYGNGSWVNAHTQPWGVPLKVNEESSRAFGGRAIGRKVGAKIMIISNGHTRIKDIRVDVTQ